MTRQQVAELFRQRLAGGTPSDDFEPTLSEINNHLDVASAYAAKVNYSDGANIDVEFIADTFYSSYKNLALVVDTDTGIYKADLPTSTIGIPRGYDIEAFIQVSGFLSKPMLRVTPQQLGFVNNLPKPPNAVLYWTEGKELFVQSDFDLTGKKAMVRMASSAGKRELTDEFLCPDAYLNTVFEYLFKIYSVSVPQDHAMDGLNQK